jgi:tetratricopeptide (TPR) repeat protein
MSRKNAPQNQPGRPDLQHTLQQCNRLLQAKKFRKALIVCRRHLDVDPDNAEILNLAGTISYHDGLFRDAEDFLRRAIQLAPRNPLFHVNLANTLSKSGKTREAETCYKTALGLSPDNQIILSNLARHYADMGNTAAAVQHYQRLLNINPGHPAALGYLERFYRNFLQTSPQHVAALKNLGIVLMQMEKTEEARECFSRACALDPDDMDIMVNLAYVYYLLDEPGKAEPLYRKLVELDPDNAQSHHWLGITLNSLGRTADAVASLRKAVQLDPTLAYAHKQLSQIMNHREYDEDIRMMEQILETRALDATQKSQLHFGLGKAYEDLQEYDRAFGHYASANDLERSTREYSINEDIQLFADITNTFNTELFETFSTCGHPDTMPVFIIGMPRSGTTLVEQILSRHPDVYAAGEIGHLGVLIRGHFIQQLQSRFPQQFERLAPATLKQLGNQYCDIIAGYDKNARYVTNKTPHNFLYVGMIRLMLPNAKIIHCTRNPLDTCFSCYANSFRKGQDYANSLNDLGRYYGLYYELMQHWRQLEVSDIIEINYEDLVKDQKQQTRRLLDACDLEWNNACLDFHKSDRAVMTASVNQVRSGLYNKSIQRWKHFESHLGPLIDVLGNALTDWEKSV